MNPIIENKLSELTILCKQYKIKSLYAFGSVNDETFNSESDIDFLISFENDISIEEYTNNYFSFHYTLQELFKRNIDLLTENSLSNPYFIKGIEKTKQLLYAA